MRRCRRDGIMVGQVGKKNFLELSRNHSPGLLYSGREPVLCQALGKERQEQLHTCGASEKKSGVSC